MSDQMMSTQELKTDLHRLIDQTQNDQLLAAVRTILDMRRDDESSDFWNRLTPDQQDDIKVGIADIEAGRTMSASDVFNRYV